MKIFYLFHELSGRGPVWFNGMWGHLSALRDSADTSFLAIPLEPPDVARRPLDRIMRRVRRREPPWAARIRDQIRAECDPNGPNVLLHIALSRSHLDWSDWLEPVWSLFDRRVLYVVDALQPEQVWAGRLQRYDLVACYCRDLGDALGAAHGVPTLYWPSHTDVLGFHSAADFRPIDLIVVGRRDTRQHGPLHRHFNDPGRDRIFLDFVTRTQGPTTAEEEFRLLTLTQARSKAAFCFEAGDRPRFAGRSPFLARWVYAWGAGCTVFGSRPTGIGAAAQMDWPESMFDLPGDSAEAIGFVEAVLRDEEGLRRRRRRNVTEALRRHDTRHRLRGLLAALDLEEPPTLQRGLDRIGARVRDLEDETPRSPARALPGEAG
jgi:hypothetical protein